MKRLGLLIALGTILFVGLLLYFSLGLRQYRVEVCMKFQERTSCRVASASSKEQALRAATENACALIASGMTDSIACQNTPPAGVRWLDSD
ncbi:MAG: hypothetical protein ACRD7E_22930 [Bryobacteraceae bacterium]